MCGICGIIRYDGKNPEREVIGKMTQALYHRGPDDEGFHFGTNGKSAAGLGFRRLSIIDVAGGRQPMKYKDLVLVFNGEIYNYRELKKECEQRGEKFLTQSDTEVILHLYDRLGEKSLDKLNGMFAFAVWNEATGEIFLARDRLGIKPLYYFHGPQAFAFASEMKSLYLSGLFPLDFDLTALGDFFSYRFVPAPHTVLKSVKKVIPGRFLRIKEGKAEEKTYWALSPSANTTLSFSEVEKELETLLEDSVRMQMVSDVPLGAFLSGGVDSSLITAFMVRNSSRKIQTFSIGFEKGTGVDESSHARKVADFLGTEHHELILNENDLARSEAVFSRMNEPVADPTILPTAILSEFTRKSVTVALTGEGGDELFAGYNRYKDIVYPYLKFEGKIDPQDWFPRMRDFPPAELSQLFPGWSAEKTYLGYGDTPLNSPGIKWGVPRISDPLNEILRLEQRTSLADRLLMKVDMASMAYSLEARPPYLDHRVVELSNQIPGGFKIRRFKGKYILRKIAERHLPKDICWRKKHGFIVPIWKWIESRGKTWLAGLMDEKFLEEVPGIEKNAVQNKIQKIYNNGSAGDLSVLWPLAVLALWRRSLRH